MEQDNGERGEHSLSTRNGAFRDAHEGDFESWWIAFGRVGTKKARAADLYAWWLDNGATAELLMTAAVAYQDYCAATGTISMHATTFLAKPAKGKSPIWPEWTTGEPHGSMDVTAQDRLNDVLAACALSSAESEGSNGHRKSRYAHIAARSAGTAPVGADARRGLPAGELADGE